MGCYTLPVTVSHSQASALLMPTSADLQFVPDLCLPHPPLKAKQSVHHLKQSNHHLAGSIPGPSPKWWVVVSVSCQLVIAPTLCLLWDPYLLADQIAIIKALLGSLSQTGPGL